MKRMSLVAIAAIGLLVGNLATSASARDLNVGDNTLDWTGFYVGAQVGYGSGDTDTSFPGFAVFSVEQEPEGILGGFYFGYNRVVHDRWLAGLEFDYASTAIDSENARFLNSGVPSGDGRWAADLNWTAAIRARIGYAWNSTLIYAAGGYAMADVDVSRTFPGASNVEDGATYSGFTIGGGIDHAFTERLIARAEIRYSDFGTESFSGGGVINREHQLDIVDVRIGLAYKF